MSKVKKTTAPHYELLYIVSNKFTEEEVKPLTEKIETVITSNGGEITYRETWGKKRLAYPIQGFGYGYYQYLEFDVDPEKSAKIERTIRLMSEVLRHQIVKRSVRTADLPEKPKPLFTPEPKAVEPAKAEKAAEPTPAKAEEEVKEAKEAKSTLKDLDEKLDKILETNDLL